MATTKEIIKVFVGSPEDVREERNALERVVTELNSLWGSLLGMQLELIRWETHAYPGFGEDAQDVINKAIPDNYHVFIGVMWTRFGSATGRAGSGTEEEFEGAYNRFVQDPDSIRIMFYFKDQPVSPSHLDPKQLMLVQQFQSKLRSRGSLDWTFNSVQDFESLLRRHLTFFAQDRRARFAAQQVRPMPYGAPLSTIGLGPFPILSEPPLPPHVFTGTAQIDGVEAPDGTLISAWIDGHQVPGASSHLRDGKYVLLVPGTDTNAQQTVVFKVDVLEANETHVWQMGGVDELHLTARRGGRVPPHVFVGHATIGTARVADGTVVSAWVNGQLVASTVVNGGSYAIVVDQGDMSFRGRTVSFKVGTADALETARWTEGGGDELNLSIRR